jgi:hypothetical protein
MIDSLYLGQLNIKNLKAAPENSFYIEQKAYFLHSVSYLFENQMSLRASYKQIDPNILSYLTLTISDQ